MPELFGWPEKPVDLTGTAALFARAGKRHKPPLLLPQDFPAEQHLSGCRRAARAIGDDHHADIGPAVAQRHGADPVGAEEVKAIVDAGGRVVASVDSPFVTFADSLHVEMRLYAEAGIPTARVHQLATIEGAKGIGVDSETGSETLSCSTAIRWPISTAPGKCRG